MKKIERKSNLERKTALKGQLAVFKKKQKYSKLGFYLKPNKIKFYIC